MGHGDRGGHEPHLYFPQHEAEKRTLAELIERQLDTVKAERPDDYERQRVMLEWWKAKLGAYTLNVITPELVTRHRDLLQREEGFSNGTVNRYLTMLSKTFNNAITEWHSVRDNAVSRVSKKPEPAGVIRFLDDAQSSGALA